MLDVFDSIDSIDSRGIGIDGPCSSLGVRGLGGYNSKKRTGETRRVDISKIMPMSGTAAYEAMVGIRHTVRGPKSFDGNKPCVTFDDSACHVALHDTNNNTQFTATASKLVLNPTHTLN